MKNFFKKLELKFKKLDIKRGTRLDLLTIAITLIITASLVYAQKWAEKIGNEDIDFSKIGTVRIINVESEKYLSADGSINGSKVSQFSKDGIHNQVWQMEKQGEGWIIKIVSTSQCLEIQDGSKDDGAKAQIWSCVGAPQQIWKIEKLEKGVYTIRPLNSGKCLEIMESSKNDGVAAQQWSCEVVMGQRWQIFSALY